MVGVYFLFVMVMCCLELAITMLVMNLHNRAASEPLRALPPWVRSVSSSASCLNYALKLDA